MPPLALGGRAFPVIGCMRKTSIAIMCLLLLPLSLGAEDYQYQFFKEKDQKKHLPFSDYIPKVRLHYKTVPHYLEDYYELYGKKQYYNENTLRMNIARLTTALECKFRHPSEALVPVSTEEEYRKYRNLMFMHIHLLIMRSHMRIASRYDKRVIKFYNLDFAKEIAESLDIARTHYSAAIPHWEHAQRYARSASEIKLSTELGFMESERYRIIKGETDFGKIIGNYLALLDRKKETLDAALAEAKK